MKTYLESNKSTKEYIQEAFAKGKSKTVMEKLNAYLSKKIGQQIFMSDKSSDYSNNYGDFSGYYCIVGDGKKAYRINFLLGKSDSISSIDYYDNPSNKPTMTIEFSKSDNIVDIAGTIEAVLKGERINESKFVERASFAGEVFEKWLKSDEKYNIDVLQNDRLSDVYKNNFDNWVTQNDERPLSSASFNNMAKTYLSDNGLRNKFSRSGIVKKGSNEKPIVNKAEEKKFDDAFAMTVEEKFQQIDASLDLLSNRWANSMIVMGAAGLGKTHQILERLKKLNLEYSYNSGGLKSAKDLYVYLYHHKDDELIICDDFDDVLLNSKAQNLLKAVLDTNKQKENIVTYLDKDFLDPEEIELLSPKMRAKKTPNSFKFTSAIVFITNLPKRKLNPAVVSRSLPVDLDLTKEEIIQRIEDKMEAFPPDAPKEIKYEALQFIKEHSDKFKIIDFRMFDKVVTMAMTRHPLWKKWVMAMLLF